MCPWILRLNIVESVIYKFNAVLKILASSFVDTDKLNLKYTWNQKRQNYSGKEE